MIYVGCVMRIRTMAALLEYVPRLSQNALRIHGMDTLPFNLYLYKYENVCVCVFAFFSAIWNPIGIPFGTKFFFAELLPFLYFFKISL